MSGAEAAAPSRPIRYRSGSWLIRFYAVFGVFVLMFGTWQIWTGITWHYGKFKAPIFDFSGVLSLVIGPLMVGFGSLMLFGFLRTPAILTAGALRVPKGFRRISIPVQDIAGVGLVFKSAAAGTRVPAGWYLTVWRTDGDSRYTGIGYFPAVFRRNKRGGGKSRSLIIAKYDPVADTDAHQLSSTHAAQVARDIYDHVLARQGPSGPLAVQQLQKHVHAGAPWSTSPIPGFWSPDGVLGPSGGSTDLKT